MKKLILFLLLTITLYPQSDLLLLMGDEGIGEYPVTDDLFASYTELEMTISNWTDQTGSADFLQATVDIQPTLIESALNGFPALRFNNDAMIMESPIIVQPMTIYFVMKLNSWTDSEILLQDIGGILVALGGGANNAYINAGTNYEPIRSYSAGTFRISAIVLNGASSLWQVNDDVATGNPGTAAFDFLNLSSSAKSDWVCMYMHSTAHDLATRTAIINWLNAKYGLY